MGPARGSLSRRLLWLTSAVVLMVQVLFFIPAITRERRDWLQERIAYGQLAALSFDEGLASPHGEAGRREVLQLAGVEAVRLTQPGGDVVVLGSASLLDAGQPINLRQEDNLRQVRETIAALADGRDRPVSVQAPGPVRPGTRVAVAFRSTALTAHLRSFARDIAGIGLLVAAVTGLFLHFALRVLLVRPMRRLTDSIASFRADPERTPPLEADRLTPLRGDEIALAGHELAEMQRELRAALWRYARLAALGTASAKVSHDLRSMLAPALLLAERLQSNADPSVRRVGDTVVRAVERATELVRGGLEFAREGPITLARSRFALRDVVAEAAEQLRSVLPGLMVDNLVQGGFDIDGDREQIGRVLGNLLRNAAEAGATMATVGAASGATAVEIIVADNGPGLPQRVQAALFKPFVTGGRRGSTGLGLAIARDLMRAHLGDIDLLTTGPQGTRFRLTLPATLSLQTPLRAAATG